MFRFLYLSLGQRPSFWKTRSRYLYAKFVLHRTIFGIKKRVGDGKAHGSIFVSLTVTTLKALSLSLAFIGLLQFIDPFVAPLYKKLALTTNSSSYANLLAAIAATGGVLIGLYYAAITSIAGAIYSRVPHNVRGVFAEERVGNVYMRFLAALTFSAVVLLALHAAGFAENIFALMILSVGAGIAIIAFVKVGTRAYNLFDPSMLGGELVYQIVQSYERSTPGHYQWDEPSFQLHG